MFQMIWRRMKLPAIWIYTKSYSFVGVAILILLVINIIVIYIGLDNDNVTIPTHEEDNSRYYEALQKYFEKRDGSWKFPLSIEGFKKQFTHKSDSIFQHAFDCTSLSSIKNMTYIATGWTKVSYYVRMHNMDIALKMVNVYGHDVTECLGDPSQHLTDCYHSAAAKLLREIFLLKKLAHQNVVTLLGYCIPDKEYNGDLAHSVLVATEFGQPIDIISLLQMSWEDRLRIALDMALLLNHLAHSPFGSLLMSDFRRQQFVLVKGKLKLSDVDDIVINDPTCISSKNCTVHIPHRNLSSFIPCHNGICHGFNEKKNVLSASRHFMNFLLSHGVPKMLEPYVDRIVDAYGKASWRIEKLLKKTKEVVYFFVHGLYRNETSSENALKNYEVLGNSDLPQLHDYHCQLTLSGHGCTLSMFDAIEAAEVCMDDAECKAFVFTNDLTWTGRVIVHFKNGYSTPVKSLTTRLFVKKIK